MYGLPRSGRTTKMLRYAVDYVAQRFDAITAVASIGGAMSVEPIVCRFVLLQSHIDMMSGYLEGLIPEHWTPISRHRGIYVWSVYGANVRFEFVTRDRAMRMIGQHVDLESVDHAVAEALWVQKHEQEHA